MIYICQEQVAKYQALYETKHGVPLDEHQARVELTALVCYVQALQRHIELHNWPDLSDI